MRDLGLILLVIFLVYLITSILFLYSAKKKEIEKTTAKTLQAYAPRNKRPYFSIHYFSSGWDEAKKSLPQFILFVILSPLIFLSWVAWLIFGKDKPKDFKRVYPPGGRPTGTTTYPQDDKALQMILEKGKSPKQVFEIMRPDYYPDEIWDDLDPLGQRQAYDAFRNRIANRMENNS